MDLDLVRAFLPGSLVDVRPVRDPAYLEGNTLEFKVIKLDQKRNNVVVSRRAVVEEEYSAEREALLKNLQEGIKLKGVVKNLTDYGAFVDLGGIDGLLHITDMAWKRVKHPSEVVNVGDELEVRVLKFDRERSRVSLGLKQLGADPWTDLSRRYPHHARLFGRVTNIADYGCFVEIEEGVEGLVHVSEMDWTNKNVSPHKVVQIGDEVEVMVLDIDGDRRRISLGIKQLQAPTMASSSEFPQGRPDRGADQVDHRFVASSSVCRGASTFWSICRIVLGQCPGDVAVRKLSKGRGTGTTVLAIDPERERISLGVKQLDKDPLSQFIADHAAGSIVRGVIQEVDARGATVALGDGVIGRLRATEISRDRVDDARMVLKPGEEIEAKLTGIDRRHRSVTLSVKEKEASEEAQAIWNYKSEAGKPAAGTTLGDLLKEQMSSD